MKIDSLCNIYLGYQFRKKIEPDPNGNYQVIQIRDFDDQRKLQSHAFQRVQLKPVGEELLVRQGDVLFLARGHKNFAVPIENHLENTIVAGYFFLLRPRNAALSPNFLAWFLNSPWAQNYFQKTAKRGSYIPLIPKKEFSELEVPTPPLEIQKKIVRLSELANQERTILATLADKAGQFAEVACKQMLKRSL